MFKKILFLSICLSLNSYILSFAAGQQAQQFIDLNNEYYQTLDHYHWVNENGNWYYENDTGDIKTGRFFDEFGNIYNTHYSSENIVISGLNHLNELFDESGYLVNRNMSYDEDIEELAKEYEEGKTISFINKEAFRNFINYYCTQYQLICNGIKFDFTTYIDTGKVESSLNSKYYYDRNAVKNQIFEKFGYLTSTDDYDKIYEACQKVCSLNYDFGYMHESMETSLINNKGVCWHFAKIAQILLQESGLHTEVVIGTYIPTGENHMWLRCRTNNKWIYVDPTLCKTIDMSYSNINYQIYVNDYITKEATYLY